MNWITCSKRKYDFMFLLSISYFWYYMKKLIGWQSIMHTYLVGKWNGTDILGNSFSSGNQHALVQHISCTWAFIPDKWKLMFTQNLYPNIYSGFLCNSFKLKLHQISFNRLNKQWYIHIREYYSKSKLLIHIRTWMCLQGMILSEKKKPIFKSMLYIWFHFEIASFSKFSINQWLQKVRVRWSWRSEEVSREMNMVIKG